MHWPTFIDDIVGASKSSESLCTNNMTILKLLRCVGQLETGRGRIRIKYFQEELKL